MSPNWHKDPGCKTQPLFEIPLERVVVDELHMFLRITDILEKGVIYEVIHWDEVTASCTNMLQMIIIIGFPSFNGSRVLFKSVCIPVYNITCTVLFVLVAN